MILRTAIAAAVAATLVFGGLIAYGYSLQPDPQPVTVEIPNDQFPQ